VDLSQLDRRCGGHRYVALRRRDIQPLRRFRNEQIAVLRQRHPLGEEDQERWFDEVVTPTHLDPEPSFLLVSILDGDESFIGYGGLTNVDWHHRRAEISFLVSPERAADAETYRADACAFLEWIQGWAFDELGLHRLFNETYEFRTEHIHILEEAGFVQEGRLRHNIVDPFDPSRFIDSLIHGRCADRRGAT
jgi:RimJ/RimL family protein N-acetyltransferase